MKATHLIMAAATLALAGMTACHKADNSSSTTNNNNNNAPATPATSQNVIADFITNTARPDYNDMYNNALTFQTAENSFYANPNDADLDKMRTAWKGMRAAYEAGEAFLIGPIATQDLDPDIDTWPVDQNDMNAILNSSATFNASTMDTLNSSLKGFHPVEYMIFGNGGTATAASFTTTTSSPTGPRKKEYLHALTANLVSVITQIKNSYVSGSSNDYGVVLNSAGPGDTTYPSRKAALLDIVHAMADICNEVGSNDPDGKINSVYNSNPLDITLQESYFSDNSWTDFTNNITGVKNVYFAMYKGGTQGHSLQQLVAAKNISLDNTIQTKINNAINAFATVHLPFGQSVQPSGGERIQVQAIMTAIQQLQDVLDDGIPNNNHDLTDFVNQYVTD